MRCLRPGDNADVERQRISVYVSNGLVKFGVAEEQRRLHAAEHFRQLRRPLPCVERHGSGANTPAREIGDGRLRHVGHVQGNAVAKLYTECAKTPRDASTLIGKAFAAPGLRACDECECVGIAFGASQQRFERRLAR